MRYSLSLAVALTLFWLMNSGHYSTLMLLLGVASIMTVVLVALRMQVVDSEAQPLHLFPRLLRYWGWLAIEVVRSNIDVAMHIWRGSGSIEPRTLTMETASKTDVGKAIVANSITLTPGTIAMDVVGNRMTIHTLCPQGASGLRSLDHRFSQVES